MPSLQHINTGKSRPKAKRVDVFFPMSKYPPPHLPLPSLTDVHQSGTNGATVDKLNGNKHIAMLHLMHLCLLSRSLSVVPFHLWRCCTGSCYSQ